MDSSRIIRAQAQENIGFPTPVLAGFRFKGFFSAGLTNTPSL